MSKKIENFLNKKVVIISVIILLTALWWGSSLLFSKQVSFSVINYSHDFKGYKTDTLLKGDKIKGEFKSTDTFLGIVYLRFNDFIKVDYSQEDVLSFKIKEKGEKNWYYFNNYRTGQFKDSLLFPFGFPVIFDSKNKIYVFEIESLAGNGHNSVQLSNSKTLLSGHQYSKAEIQGSKERLIKYIFKKSFYSIQSLDFVLSSFIFALPLFIYILWIIFIRNYINPQQILTFLVPIFIIADILFLKTVYVGLLFGLLAILLLSIKLNKLNSRVSFFIAVILVIIWCILTMLGIHTYSNKLNIWAYAFIIIGLVQLIFEERRNGKSKL